MTHSLRDLLGQSEIWIFVFAAGWVLLNWPLINLAEGLAWRGVPAVLIYIASIWLLLTLAMYLFEREVKE
ncbi:MAG: hypothetical protein BWY13_01239 [Euryarchaeota archaeon ADurb.Bin190]|jgi:hypothetical protein|nr:MAG: hypothetical protein BWY13_01239 [Euryarchaeota archaeon ADurb.Bin190]HNQ53905.1 hypothetical protein [Methanothrix sp.]HPH48075.1 hypothetical protein [Methanothrix sp.]HQQ36711.1 hypothetical protein [Methanothrix sp.]